jgi:threonine dehydratase
MSALGPVLADAPTLDEVRRAAERIAPWAHRTPVLTCRAIDDRSGAQVFLKCENFQRVGAFKFRGAMNALSRLDDESRRRGVVTHSSGNHAQALACAGGIVGVPVTVVMPRTAPIVKKRATQGYGAEVVACEPTLAAREEAVAKLIATRGLTLIHPFDNWHVIAGQGTCALELIEQCDGRLDAIVAPVGGGGLIAGTAIVAKGIDPTIRVIGAEPLAADDARRSLASGVIEPSGDPKTVADGLRTSLGARPFAVIRRMVDNIVTATEPEILEALQFVWERVKVLIEPSCAVPVAPVLNRQIDVQGLRVGIILSGGNVDLSPVIEAMAAR